MADETKRSLSCETNEIRGFMITAIAKLKMETQTTSWGFLDIGGSEEMPDRDRALSCTSVLKGREASEGCILEVLEDSR